MFDLCRTAKAIEEYDAYDARYEKIAPTARDETALNMLGKLNALGEAVGIAFGHDTAGLNSLDTCRLCVRPGARVPPPGFDNPSWVRRQVLRWRNESWKR